jgi:hypothetical protein
MPELVTLTLNKPFATPAPTIQVAGMTKPGRYVFRLIVTDEVGISSGPALVTVVVQTLPGRRKPG